MESRIERYCWFKVSVNITMTQNCEFQITENENVFPMLHALLDASLVLWIKMEATLESHVSVAVFVVALLI